MLNLDGFKPFRKKIFEVVVGSRCLLHSLKSCSLFVGTRVELNAFRAVAQAYHEPISLHALDRMMTASTKGDTF